ncbi:hypothetical protein D8674_003489 [Pyrus ussuriensis x Pyrus communis]|uniref:Uncharacterized protein n=1 Tax=Pyrus ussuriensis x Pyrus communis TaxID=2448454 RepID=A0A5N5FW42_9ROSA|nr:hypothetical protein D8674_003489 [Pyrus ussuriensis x Pyrus communis]
MVCTVIVLISPTVERILFYTDKYLEKKTKRPVLKALQKTKEGPPSTTDAVD